VKVLKSIAPISPDETILGQYGSSLDGKHESYLSDKTVPKGSTTATFALTHLHINNTRWSGVPFILRSGKALNERKCEVRIFFHPLKSGLYQTYPNELVIRIQPKEAIYLKMAIKKPGFEEGIEYIELDLTYLTRFGKRVERIPEAYERLIHDVIKGDHTLFVRNDEVMSGWKIFTPLLHHIENKKVRPVIYPYGSRGPSSVDEFLKKLGFEHNKLYQWNEKSIQSRL